MADTGGGLSAFASPLPARLDGCNVVWKTPGCSPAGSMPVGNGDVGLNAWVETNGDLEFYIGKNDAWRDDLSSPGYDFKNWTICEQKK